MLLLIVSDEKAKRNIIMTNDVQQRSGQIDLRELFAVIWNGKWIVSLITSVFTVAAVVYALSLPDVYKSEALLAPVSEEAGLKVPGQLGGLAALAGVNLAGLGGGDKTELALEIIKSRDFLGRFIEMHNLYIPIMAAEGWNRAEDTLLIDEDIYDIKRKEWVREVKAPFQPKPSVLETHEEFLKLVSVSKDKISGMVKVSVEYYSPYMAKLWVDELIKAINAEMRQRDLIEAQRSIDYLNNQIELTTISDVRAMLFSLIEEQTKTVMLANVRDEYVFKTVDPAVVAEKKAKPARALIVVLAFLLGVMVSILGLLIRHFNLK